MTDHATRSGTNFAMSGHVAGDSTDDCAFDASFRIRSRSKVDADYSSTSEQ